MSARYSTSQFQGIRIALVTWLVRSRDDIDEMYKLLQSKNSEPPMKFKKRNYISSFGISFIQIR